MYRWRLADELLHPDRFGDFHDDRAQMRDTQPRGGGDEHHWVCSMCGRGSDAVADCAICGDHEDMAA